MDVNPENAPVQSENWKTHGRKICNRRRARSVHEFKAVEHRLKDGLPSALNWFLIGELGGTKSHGRGKRK
jgi:hypothetical protein